MSDLAAHQYEENSLPIYSFKEKILKMLRANTVVIIQGPAGCGKTTQVPQYILNDSREKKQVCNIAVALPTKIAAINIARRVCEQGGSAVGTACGYDVGLEKKMSSGMLLTYMPTDILLQKIISAQSMDQFTHIFIDDFQERSQNLDLLLLVLKRFLLNDSVKTKVILMSAPNDVAAEEFAQYFGTKHGVCLPAPIIYANKETNYTRSISYIEDIYHIIGKAKELPLNFVKPVISEGVWKIFVYLVSALGKIDERNSTTNEPILGTVLVFLPGIEEVEIARNRLLKKYKRKKNMLKKKDKTANKQRISSIVRWEIISLHSITSMDLQEHVFKLASSGYRKVILCTGVAENSITIPDTYYVIDFCQSGMMKMDPVYNEFTLKAEWASHINCEQRAGRVGRTGNGKVFRLVSKTFYEKKMPKSLVPEMLRAPAERVVLQAKMLGINESPREILALAMDPPTFNIEKTILTLKEIGGLLPTCRGSMSTSDGDLTFLGTVMASLPIDVRLSKLIVLGHLFGCLEEAIIIAAGCSIPKTFPVTIEQMFNAYKERWPRTDGCCSDFLDLLDLYQDCGRDKFKRQWWNTKSANNLYEWNLLVTDIKQRLEHMNIKATTGSDKILLSDHEKEMILNVVTAGAFYPNYFINDKPQQLNEADTLLEMELRGCISSSTNKVVDVDCRSANTVLLDTESEHVHTRLLVAGYISQTHFGRHWTLHQTSLLPDIPGLPMLLSLLFCPTARVKLTEDGTRASSILCGSGYNKFTRRANYPSHDLTLTLDTELTLDEANRINQIRSYMNKGIQLISGMSGQTSSMEEMIKTQNYLKMELNEIIFISRKPVERVSVKFANDWRENNNNNNAVLKPDMCSDGDIWPMLSFIELSH